MTESRDKGICREKSGFLFSHKCQQPAATRCGRCRKTICRDHSHALVGQPGNILCTTCAKNDRKDKRQGTGGKRRGYDGHESYDYDEPYFYGGYYYGSEYYASQQERADPNDFTEADAESLAGEMDEGFESDMSES